MELTLHRRKRTMSVLLGALLLCSAACGAKPPAPAVHAAPVTVTAAPAEPNEPAEPADGNATAIASPHDPFEQPDDLPVDSKALLKEMRHDCCTELPAAELEKHRQQE
jgi:hypothetical protein